MGNDSIIEPEDEIKKAFELLDTNRDGIVELYPSKKINATSYIEINPLFDIQNPQIF